VHRLVTRVGGTITASSPSGARFEVALATKVGDAVRAAVHEGVS
jgi:hypothetical protein